MSDLKKRIEELKRQAISIHDVNLADILSDMADKMEKLEQTTVRKLTQADLEPEPPKWRGHSETVLQYGAAGLDQPQNIEVTQPDRTVDVEVAKALGYKTFLLGMYDTKTNKPLGDDWVMAPMNKPPYFNTVALPHYSTDIAAAIQAMEEYCKVVFCRYQIEQWRDGEFTHSCQLINGDGVAHGDAESLPLAICNAIIAHAKAKEGK